MLGFSKRKTYNGKLYNMGAESEHMALLEVTDKVLAQVFIGNYKTIENSIPEDSQIVEMIVSPTSKGQNLLLKVRSLKFKLIEPKKKYPVIGLRYKRQHANN